MKKQIMPKEIIRKITLFPVCLLLALTMMPQIVFAADEEAGTETKTEAVDPIEDADKYSAIVYDNANGFPTSVANDMVQTKEGFLWIASYSGLIRYDGNDFERVDSDENLNSIGCMFVDSKDRLWVGTNENGIAVMENGEFRWWNEEEGLVSSKVRDIAEGKNGTIYAGTISGISMITPNGKVKNLKQSKIANAYIEEMETGKDGVIYCVTNEGDFFSLLGSNLRAYLNHTQANIKGINCVLPDLEDPGMIYVGTEDSEVYRCKSKGNPTPDETIDISPLSGVINLQWIDDKIWVLANNGIGIIDEDGFHNLEDFPFHSSIVSAMEDYQGNLWFASSRQGIMKLAPNRFSNLFDKYDVPQQVVNCTRSVEDTLFVGTETGLVVLGKDGPVTSVPVNSARYASGGSFEADNLITLLEDVRIRSIIKDSKDRLWISTWQSFGLLRYDHGELTVFNEDAGLPSDRIRVVHETPDGKILVANTGGVSVIEGDQVTGCYDQSDGIAMSETLTVATAPNGDILVGSNGGGIYVIGKDGTRCINKKEGLSSGVVMRIYYDDKRKLFWLITGNSISYMTTDYEVTTIDGFPYPDNLDMYENERGEMWVLSSDGIYVTPTENLIKNDNIQCTHYGIPNGLPGITVSNSYSELTGKGNLYIAGNNGVFMVNIDEPMKDFKEIKQAVPYISADDQRIYPDEDGTFNVPSGVKKLTVYGFVFDYSLTDPLVTCQLKGFDRYPMTFRQSELHPIVYTNLSGGTYSYEMKLKDEAGNYIKMLAVTIKKTRAFYESVWFYILAAVALMAIMFLVSNLYIKRKMRRLEAEHLVKVERDRVNGELQMANRIQMGFLPHEFPPFPDRHEFDLYASMDPAREVGGDFYDYFLIDDDHLCLVIADVSGKGVPASLYMMNSKVVLQTVARTGVPVEEILTRVNDMLCSNNPLEMFITAWVGILELSTGKLTASNAGHEYPVLTGPDGKFEMLEDKHGLVLGGMEGMKYQSYELQLQPGDKLFVYTDGLPEATDVNLKMFGKDRMLDALNQDPDVSPQQLLKNVRAAVDDFVKEAEQFDDLTMLCLHYNGNQAKE